MAMYIKKGDTVEVIAGDDCGRRGRVLSVNPVKGSIIIEGINQAYKHVKPSQSNPQGGRLHIEKAIDISNVLPINPKTDKPTRVRYITEGDRKVRVAIDGTKI